MYEELLNECGLTQNETLVYLALLRKGKSKSGEIVREAKISGGKVYETLYRLIDKGLVKSVSENSIKHFIANDPKTLLIYLEEKKKDLMGREGELKKIIPSLKNLKKEEIELEAVSLIRGLKGISTTIYESLEKAQIIKIMGVRSSKDEKYNNFWRNWHRKRVGLHKKALILFSDKNTEYWKFFKKLRYTQVKEILHFSPSAIMIVDKNTFIFSYEKELTCIHIFSEPITKSFSNFFDDLWKLPKR